jgi:hypothetical protein
MRLSYSVRMNAQTAIARSAALLKWSYGIVLIVIGLDKALQIDFITFWPKYISPLAHTVLPVSDFVFTVVLGSAEVVVGILLLFFWTRYVAYVVIAVLAIIVIDLIDLGMYDIAARDILVALGALVLAWLTEAQESRMA